METSWEDVCQQIIPIFQGRGCGYIEDLNVKVKEILAEVEITQLELKLTEFLQRAGCESLKSKLAVTGDDTKLPHRLVELWTFYFGTILPQMQAIFLPMERDLTRVSIGKRTIRTIVLQTFRDEVILPNLSRIQEAFQRIIVDPEESRRFPDTVPRVMQMLNILNELPCNKDENTIEMALKNIESQTRQKGCPIHISTSQSTVNSDQ